MFKKLIILLFVIAPIGAFAQNKLAYISSDDIIAQMPEVKDYETKIMAKREEVNKNLTTMQNEYQKKIEEFQQSTDSLTESILLDRQKQIQQLEERIQTYYQNGEKELSDLSNQLLAPIHQKYQKAVQEVGAEQGFTYIFEAGALRYYSSSAIDAGPMVKTKLGLQ